MPKSALDPALSVYLDDRERLIVIACRLVESRAVAEEIVQESWLRWHRQNYAPESAKPLFHRIVRNLALDWQRRRAREVEALISIGHDVLAAPDTDRICAARQDLVLVARALRRMPPRTVRALRLRAEDGLSFSEIGRRLNLSRSRAHEIVEDAIVTLSLALDG